MKPKSHVRMDKVYFDFVDLEIKILMRTNQMSYVVYRIQEELAKSGPKDRKYVSYVLDMMQEEITRLHGQVSNIQDWINKLDKVNKNKSAREKEASKSSN